MLLDVTPPPLENVYIYGELVFEDHSDYNFTANLVSRTVRCCVVSFVLVSGPPDIGLWS